MLLLIGLVKALTATSGLLLAARARLTAANLVQCRLPTPQATMSPYAPKVVLAKLDQLPSLEDQVAAVEKEERRLVQQLEHLARRPCMALAPSQPHVQELQAALVEERRRRAESRAAEYAVLEARARRVLSGRPVVPPVFYQTQGLAGLERVLGITPAMTLRLLLDERATRLRVAFAHQSSLTPTIGLQHARAMLELVCSDVAVQAAKSAEPWEGVSRGSDVFVRGLKRFDIMATCNALLQKRLTMERLAAEPSADLLLDARAMLISPHELRACGHFPMVLAVQEPGEFERQLTLLSYLLRSTAPEGDKRLKHLVRFSSWWNDVDNAAALDELCDAPLGIFDARDWPEGGEKMRPPRLLRTMREARAIRGRGPDIHFDHLASLPDAPPLCVIRSSHALADVGAQLGNCAAAHSNLVRRQLRVLVVARSPDGKPFALGAHPACPTAGRAGWMQIRERYNRPASQETWRLYDSYLPTIYKWWTDRYGPPREDDV